MLLAEENPFGDDSVLLSVSAELDPANNWQFSYNIMNPGASVFYITVGIMNPADTSELYDVVGVDNPLPAPADAGLSDIVGNELAVYFMPFPGLPPNFLSPDGFENGHWQYRLSQAGPCRA